MKAIFLDPVFIMIFIIVVLIGFSGLANQDKEQTASRSQYETQVYAVNDSITLLTVERLLKEDYIYISIRKTYIDDEMVYEINGLRAIKKR